ncbi:hypothetical protein FIBSPDRAFT_958749 [Athelia psychrophila]|uniref:Uncharacterized protein n=1 Tax=Athelia psychrophila TaxID=1759441 RepID=A0A166EB09_9AGAM|nr:hypothetical protein FIBSPDRAFT_958749 [Fibularhizoctonia sp. CBS 109695]
MSPDASAAVACNTALYIVPGLVPGTHSVSMKLVDWMGGTCRLGVDCGEWIGGGFYDYIVIHADKLGTVSGPPAPAQESGICSPPPSSKLNSAWMRAYASLLMPYPRMLFILPDLCILPALYVLPDLFIRHVHPAIPPLPNRPTPHSHRVCRSPRTPRTSWQQKKEGTLPALRKLALYPHTLT